MGQPLLSGARTAIAAGLIILTLGAAAPATAAADEFIRNLHKADRRKAPDERIEYYSRAIRAWKPSHSSTLLAYCLFKRGQAYYESYELELAHPDLTEAIEKDPDNASAFFLRGSLLLLRGLQREALMDLRTYVAMKPKDIEGRLRLAECLLKDKRYRLAAKEFRSAQEMDPDDFRPPLGLATVQHAKRQCLNAAQPLEKADSLAQHRSPRVLALRGECRNILGYPESGLKDLGEAIGLYETRLNDLQRSLALRKDFFIAKGRLARTYDTRGDIFLRGSQPGAALADYKESCQLQYRPACLKAERLGVSHHGPKAEEFEKIKEPKKAKKKKRRRRDKRGDDDPGQRIYGF